MQHFTSPRVSASDLGSSAGRAQSPRTSIRNSTATPALSSSPQYSAIQNGSTLSSTACSHLQKVIQSQSRIECGACKGVMQYDSSAVLVKCPFCTSINYSKNGLILATPIGVLKCGACFTDSFYPLHGKSAIKVASVMACQCGAINQVPGRP